ncbi:MAG: MATE family efflux transporter [Chitinivibrionales bacterium]|nr:MATE family efflux transporter [Chitinivibrionales bacterium]
MNVRSAKLTSGPVGKTLINLAAPMLVGIIAMMAFNLIDTFYVAKLGTRKLAAMVLTFPVVMIIASFALGLGVGAVVTISRAIGESDHEKVRRLATDSLTLSVTLVAVLVTIGLFTIEPVFFSLGATPDNIHLVKQYMRIWYFGMVFVVVPMVGNNAIRATGDTKTPSIIMLIAVAINGILDPLLIFGIGPFPRLELAGAALATVIARACTLTISLSILHFREQMLASPFAQLPVLITSWWRVLKTGLPVAASNVLIPFTIAIVTRLVSGYGPEAVAGYGIATRVEAFSLTLVFALSVSLGPFIGQNFGARDFNRIEKGIKYSMRFSLLWGGVVFLILYFAGESIAVLFNTDNDVVSVATRYFMIVPASFAFFGMHQFSWASLNALDNSLHSAGLEIIRSFVVLIPAALLGSKLWGIPGIFAAILTANTIAGIVSRAWLKRMLGKMREGE